MLEFLALRSKLAESISNCSFVAESARSNLMKKIFSPLLIALITLSGISPALSQKSPSSRTGPISEQRKLPVQDSVKANFRSAEGFTDGNGAVVEWEMASETSNLGFFVYRIDQNGKHLVSDVLIPGSSATYANETVSGERYSLLDPIGTIGAVYVIEALNVDGTRINSEVFASYVVSDLRPIIGRTSEETKFPRSETSNFVDSELNPGKTLQSEIEENSFAPDNDTHRWVIAQPGVRVGVRQEGMHRITSAQLSAAGFDTTTDPALWQLFVEGNQQAIIVGSGGSYVEFYGKGVDTLESDTQTYFLIVGSSAGKRMQVRAARPSNGTVVSQRYEQTFTLRERTNYNNQILNGDAGNFWGRTVTSTPTTLNFTLTGVDQSASTANVTVRFQGFSLGLHNVQITLNGNILGLVPGTFQDNFSATFQVPANLLIEGGNTLQMAGASGQTPNDVTFFDSVEVTYGRKYITRANGLDFHSELNRRATIQGFSSPNVRVFDTTSEGSLQEVINVPVVADGASFSALIPAARSRRFYTVEDAAMLQPVSIVANNTETLSDPSNNASFVIISHSDFLTEAQTWAAYRQGQGINTKVVDVQEIYDEFNFGVLSAESIKSFLRMTSTGWASAPGYVLLIGDATVNPRGYGGAVFRNYMPTRMIDTIFTETGSDEFLADFNGDGLSEMAIGRIPARTGANVTAVFNKTVNWEANSLNSLSRGALFAHDRIDGYDFQAMNNRIRNQLPVDMPSIMVHRDDPNAQATLVSTMNTGKFAVNYSGHGSTGAWAASNFFANTTLPQLTNASNESIFTILTCLNGYFISQGQTSLAENLIHGTNGGAVAAWASTGLTTPDIQELMAVRFYNKLGEGRIPLMGDLIRDAKGVIPGGSDVRLSWALFGDPMLKVRQPASFAPVKQAAVSTK